MPGVACSSPAVILAHLAAHTDRIRLGSGGVMLPNHAPLVIAEQFGTLEALAPGRVDLGPGPGARHGRRDRRGPAPPARLRRGRGGIPAAARRADPLPGRRLPRRPPLLAASTPSRARSRRRRVRPGRPPVWLLGSSGFSARLAGAARSALRLRAPLLGGEHPPRAGPVPRVLPALGGAGRAVRPDRRRRPRRRRRAGGPPPGPDRRPGDGAAAHRPARPGPHARRRRRRTSSAPWSGSSWTAGWPTSIHGTPDAVRDGPRRPRQAHRRRRADAHGQRPHPGAHACAPSN